MRAKDDDRCILCVPSKYLVAQVLHGPFCLLEENQCDWAVTGLWLGCGGGLLGISRTKVFDERGILRCPKCRQELEDEGEVS